MKICVYYVNNDIKVGLVDDNNVIDVLEAYKSVLMEKGYSEDEAEETIDSLLLYPENLALTWNVFEHILGEIQDHMNIVKQHKYPLEEVALLPPISQPQKIIGVALNYQDLADQLGKTPNKPIFFLKSPSAIIGPKDPIVLPSVTKNVDFEAELVVVIKDVARNIDVNDADRVILGYTIGNDVTARDIQYSSGKTLYSWSKSLDTFAPIGPWIVTKDEIPDPQNLRIRLWINDEIYQDSNTANMIKGVKEIVSEASKYLTLYPGDLIFTGTPAGTGFALKPPRFLRDGDTVRIEIEKIGVLENPVKRM